MTDNRSSSALFKRAEQLKRWEESDTNKQSPTPRRASRIQFSSGIVFLAACTAGDKDEVQRLLKRGADINTANVDGLTALHQACIDDNLDMVEFLVTHGADVNRGDNEGWTPLHATSSCGFLSIARYLLENGADVAAVNYDGELPVDIAESDEMAELLQKVIDEKGVDCDKSRSAEVDTLLSDARNWAANGYVEVRDMNGGTPLHVAAAKGYIDVATTLLEECSADPDCVDYEGWTPLHAAALWGQKDAAALLLQYGADPLIKNYSGQTCMDLVDPTMTSWLADAMNAQRRMNNNNNKRKRSPPQHDAKRVDIEINSQPEKVVNDKPPASPEIAKTEGKPPRGRPSSPDTTETESSPEDAPSWRRSASFRNRQPEPPRENSKTVNNAVDNDTILRRTHSFENDKSFYQRYRDVTARIKASSCPSIPPAQPPTERKKPQEHTNNATESTNDDVQTRINPSDRREREVNTWSGPTTTTPSASPTNTTTTTTVRRSFVPPVRDEESETQRKAHAKRVRETRRSTQGVTLDEIKSAEQLVKKKAGNGTTESPSPGSPKKDDPTPTPAPAPTDNGSFELEDAGRSSPRPATTAAEATVTLPYRRPPTGSNANTTTSTPKDDNRTEPSGEEDKERESSTESKSSSNASPASTQAALNVIQRRRRPKRRSTGVGHVDMDDIVNDRGGGGEGCDADNEAPASGSERTEESEDKDYKALYEASQSEVRRLRALLATSEQQLREARGTITRLTQVNQNSLSEIEKREKRAMERKLSEMEEELKYQQTLQAENQRLKDENGALIRVISKLSK
ncbi:protein phosphatase 1 regulatory subunit 12C isoform X31 [Spodoptera frugiperda]|uniref:Protein phosphatase 1 regulatory subunit 12C isoform X31 n=1 Tax=Spodoptera frugiperda TaxID=7108 RepID=A0A9R0E735_SPOFR|nr:protein phosphatase 1 regulatory subunit 12C isoform X31 [Spodoptera frugiperda]